MLSIQNVKISSTVFFLATKLFSAPIKGLLGVFFKNCCPPQVKLSALPLFGGVKNYRWNPDAVPSQVRVIPLQIHIM
jgi:hypothetical protein